MPVFESEKEFEDVLMDNQELLTDEFGGDIHHRQVDLFGYGIADIVSIWKDICIDDKEMVYINVIELKLGAINLKAIEQVCRYKRGLERMADEFTGDFIVRVKATIIGSCIDDSCVYVLDSISDLKAYTYNIEAIGGLSFKSHSGWYRECEDFGGGFNENVFSPIASEVHKNNLGGNDG